MRIMFGVFLLLVANFIHEVNKIPIYEVKHSKNTLKIAKKDMFKTDTLKVTYYNCGYRTASGLKLIEKLNDGYCVASVSRYDKRYKLGDTITIKSKYISCKAIVHDYTRSDVKNCVDVYVGTDKNGLITKKL